MAMVVAGSAAVAGMKVMATAGATVVAASYVNWFMKLGA